MYEFLRYGFDTFNYRVKFKIVDKGIKEIAGTLRRYQKIGHGSFMWQKVKLIAQSKSPMKYGACAFWYGFYGTLAHNAQDA